MSATLLRTDPNFAATSRTPINHHPSCQPSLTSDVCAVLDELIPLLVRSAAQRSVPVSQIDVRGFTDPEENNAQVVVRQWAKLPPREALRYWDSLGSEYETWLCSFPASVTEQIVFEIRWVEDAPAL